MYRTQSPRILSLEIPSSELRISVTKTLSHDIYMEIIRIGSHYTFTIILDSKVVLSSVSFTPRLSLWSLWLLLCS